MFTRGFSKKIKSKKMTHGRIVWTASVVVGYTFIVSTISAMGFTLFTTFFGIPYHQCITRCENRPCCMTIRYVRRHALCELYMTENGTGIGRTPGTKEQLVPDVLNISSMCPTCDEKQIIQLDVNGTAGCVAEQCGAPTNISGSTILGNIFKVGYKMLYTCPAKSMSFEIQCQPDGVWSNLWSMCNCSIPALSNVQSYDFVTIDFKFIGLIQVCDPGYELLELKQPRCKLAISEWRDLHKSGCYKMREPPWRKIYSFSMESGGAIYNNFIIGDLFTNNLKAWGQFRNASVFDNWPAYVTQRIRLDVLVDWTVVKSITFDGSGSDPRTWMSQPRITESSWTDLTATSPIDTVSFPGLEAPQYMRFLVSKNIDLAGNCELNTGWFLVCWGCQPCPDGTGLQLLYAKGTTAAFFGSTDTGLASRLEVWIEE